MTKKVGIEKANDVAGPGDAEALTNGRELRELVHAAISILKPVEREVVVRHYGIDCSPSTLRAISIDLCLTLEQVRRRESNALRRLRQRPGRDLLYSWLYQ